MGQICKISVVGYGKVECDADILDVSFTVDRTDIKSSIAQEKVNILINKILAELKEIGIKSKDIITTTMSISENYSWEKDQRVYKGIEVSQTVRCRIIDIKKQIKKIIKIIDFVGSSNEKIDFYQRFYLEDVSKSYELCREIAYKDAYKKAEHYAKLAGTTIRGVSSISEYKNADYNYDRMECASEMSDREDDGDKSTNFSIKKISTNLTLYIDFFAE